MADVRNPWDQIQIQPRQPAPTSLAPGHDIASASHPPRSNTIASSKTNRPGRCGWSVAVMVLCCLATMLFVPRTQTTLESLLMRHYDGLRENVTRIQDLFAREDTLDLQKYKHLSLVELSQNIANASAAIMSTVQLHRQVLAKEFPVAITSSNCSNVIGAMIRADESLSVLFEWHNRTAQSLHSTTHNVCSIADECHQSLESEAARDLFMMQLRLVFAYPPSIKTEAREAHRNTICQVSSEACTLLQASSFLEHKDALDTLREGYSLSFTLVQLEKVEEIDLGPGSGKVDRYLFDCMDHLLGQMRRTIHDCEKGAKELLSAKWNSRGQESI